MPDYDNPHDPFYADLAAKFLKKTLFGMEVIDFTRENPTGERRHATFRADKGTLHRVDGPAAIWFCEIEHKWKLLAVDWYIEGCRSRCRGPATIHWRQGEHAPIGEEWWIRGKYISNSDVDEFAAGVGLPNWRTWPDEIWLLFNMRFT